jgi:uncharacterized repeat protein (TIGR02543 family)
MRETTLLTNGASEEPKGLIPFIQRVLKIFVISALTVLFFACPAESNNDIQILVQHNKATVSFSVADSSERTVLPQVSLENVASYKLLGGRNSEAETVLVETFTGTGTSVLLDPGTWNFTLNAYNSSGGHILQGKIQNRQINLTGTNQVSFSLSVINSGTGSIQITLNFPETAGITKISTNGDVASENFTSITNGTFVYTKNGITAGDYLINFELYRGAVLRTVVSELVVVRNSLTSSKTITLVGENLKPLPTFEITIDPIITGIDEWELTEQTTQATPNENKLFTVTGTYAAYRWYLDGVSVGTSSSYTFNRPAGIYQLVVVVTNSNGESRSGRYRVAVGLVTGPILSEDFEGTNSFTMVNGSYTNKWYVGTAAANGGTKSAYISNNSSSNAYTISSSSIVHMYRDVTFPSSTSPYTLTFYWKAQGESGYDYLTVRLVETSTSITAGSQLSSGTLLGTYTMGGAATWNQASISIPATNSGTTKRLVFTWYNDGSDGTQPPVAVDNIVLTGGGGVSTPVIYTVTYNINNGSGTLPAAQSVNSGSGIILPSGSGLTRTGYTFGGWNTSSTGTGTNYTAGSSYTPTGNITLYAKWNTTYTVTFSANSGTGTAPVAQTVNSGTSITLPGGSGLTRTGYTFGGWNTSSAGTGTNYDASTSYTPTESITLYAKWLPTYTVTFNVNNGTGTAPTAQSVSSGSVITLPSGSGLTRTGYTFGGWNTSSAGTGTNYDAGSLYTPTATITLYSKWNSTTGSNPDGSETNPYQLTLNTWLDGNITSATGTVWYSFPVTSGTTYRIWWNDSYDGNNTKTGIVVVGARYANQTTFILGGTNTSVYSGWSTAQSFTANQTGTVYIRVIPYNRDSSYIGTYSIAYSTSTTRPALTGTTDNIFSEDFEGTTHSFTIVNGSYTNNWYVGTATANGSTKSAYISNNSSSNAYTISSSSTVHMYRDVTFPSSTSSYTLTFFWKAQGENNYDYLTVRLVETSTSITAGSQLSSGLLGTYTMGGATTWNQASISIPAANSGTTKRLVFTWYNDSSDGTQPPVAVDNIVLTK